MVVTFAELEGLSKGAVEESEAELPSSIGGGGFRLGAPCIGTVLGRGLEASLLIGTSSPNGSLSLFLCECMLAPLRRGSPQCVFTSLDAVESVLLCRLSPVRACPSFVSLYWL